MKHNDPMDAERLQAEADAILRNPPDGLFKWLEAEGLTMDDADLSPDWNYGALNSKLKSRGLSETMEAWRKEQAPRFAEFEITNRGRVATRVIYRFALAKSKQWQSRRTKRKRDAELEMLPQQILWVYEHPLIDPTVDPDTDEGRATIAAYEQNVPAPGRGARNYLANCLKYEKIRIKLFDDVRTFQLAARKAAKELPNKVDAEGQQQVLDMRQEFTKKFKKESV